MGKLADTSLNEIVPLPFRVSLLFQFGVHLWYAIVWICYHVFNVNCLALINLSYSNHNYALDERSSRVVTGLMATIAPADTKENITLLRGIRQTSGKLFSSVVGALVCYWACKFIMSEDSVLYNPLVHVLYFFVVFYSFYVVFHSGTTMGQQRVHSSIKRILVGEINSATMRTNDIFFADTLTSYAKVLNDFMVFIWLTLVSKDSLYNTYVEAFVLSFPQLIRMKQCFREFQMTGQKLHLLNFAKYSALLGPISVNMLIKFTMLKLQDSPNTSTVDLQTLNNWWYVVSAISSLYLFIWDIRMDWGLGLLEPLFGTRGKYVPLRSGRLVFRHKLIYYCVIVIDFVVRFIWVFKMFVIVQTEIELGLRHRVGNFLFGYNFLLLGYVMLETLELIRRWLWCFLKWENDLLKLQNHTEAIPMSDLKTG